jgi:hypothetical protein
MPGKILFIEKTSLIAPCSDGGLVIAFGYRYCLSLLPQSCRMRDRAASARGVQVARSSRVFRKAEWWDDARCFRIVIASDSLRSQ